MRFDLSDDQLQVQRAVGDLVTAVCPPARVHELTASGPASDDRLWCGLMELGMGALVVPEGYGGLGLGVLDLAAAMEPLGYGVAPVPVLGHVLGTLALVRAGSPAQRSRWLPGLADGGVRAAVVWADADGEHADLDVTGVLDAVGADLLVLAGASGLALVEVDDAVRIDPLPGIDRTRSLSRVRLAGHPAQPLPCGAADAEWLRDVALTLLAADAMGGATRCVELTVAYVSVREQWGVPVGSFQAVKHQLADLALAVEPARGLYWFAAHALDQDGEPDAASRAASLAKAHVTERSVEAGRGAVELHGGIGYTWECDVHLYLKRALVDRAHLGDPRHHRARVADLSGW